MNAPVPHRAILGHHVATVEAKHPLKVIGLLPRGTAAHVIGAEALDLLADKRDGLSYFGLVQAEIDLSDLLGRPIGIVLVSELHGQEATDLPERAELL